VLYRLIPFAFNTFWRVTFESRDNSPNDAEDLLKLWSTTRLNSGSLSYISASHGKIEVFLRLDAFTLPVLVLAPVSALYKMSLFLNSLSISWTSVIIS
jgi:hypothetical protein